MPTLDVESIGRKHRLCRVFCGGNLNQDIRLGVIVNPNARHFLRGKGVQRITEMLGAQRVVQTQSIGDLPHALESLFHEQGITVLGICGGDGTIHHTINALVHLYRSKLSADPSTLLLPPVLLLRGGTLNIVARASKVEGQTVRLLRRFLRRFKQAKVRDLPLTQVNLLSVRDESLRERYGFVFGSELTARCLELYDGHFGAGYTGLVKFLHACVKAYLLKDDIWDIFEPLLTKTAGSLLVRENDLPYQAVVASTVDIKLLAGLVTGMKIDRTSTGCLGVRVLAPQSPGQLLRNLPNLILGRDGSGIVDLGDIDSFRIEPAISYSFDGEVFPLLQEGSSLEIDSPPWSLPVVAPFP